MPFSGTSSMGPAGRPPKSSWPRRRVWGDHPANIVRNSLVEVYLDVCFSARACPTAGASSVAARDAPVPAAPQPCVVGAARTAGFSAVSPESGTSQMTRAARILWPLPALASALITPGRRNDKPMVTSEKSRSYARYAGYASRTIERRKATLAGLRRSERRGDYSRPLREAAAVRKNRALPDGSANG
jgi:hypothetical protein